ncbi:MAG: sulfotransferase [Pseudomonadota bacterium]|nr:sulfotransferase [Pseudomonadota bacterium]
MLPSHEISLNKDAKYLGSNLIFLISMPRSGSTMLQRVLVGNQAIETSAEPWLLLPLIYSRRKNGLTAEYGGDWARIATEEFLKNYTDGSQVYDAAIRAFAKEIYENVLKRRPGRVFLDKTPRYIYIIKDLARIFPEAKFIFLLRNPLSVLASIINTQLDGDLWSISEFISELRNGPKNILEGTDLLKERSIVIRYEEFVEKPEKYTEQLCKFLEIEFSPNMVSYQETPEAKGFMTDRVGVQQHERPVTDRIHSWEDMLNDPQQVHFAEEYLKILEPSTIDGLGYDYGHLFTSIQQAKRTLVGFKNIFPWRVAIQQDPEMNTRDFVQAHVYRMGLTLDPKSARWKGIKLYFGQIAHAIRHLFGKRN